METAYILAVEYFVTNKHALAKDVDVQTVLHPAATATNQLSQLCTDTFY